MLNKMDASGLDEVASRSYEEERSWSEDSSAREAASFLVRPEERLLYNTVSLWMALGGANNSLRRPVAHILGRGLSETEAGRIFGKDAAATITRYARASREDAQLHRLTERTQHSTTPGEVQVHHQRSQQEEKAALEWIRTTAGVTQSGRTRNVLKSPRTQLGFFEQYVREAPSPHLGKDKFFAVCHQLHVHFHVGAVGFMSCVVCRDLKARIDGHMEVLATGFGDEATAQECETAIEDLQRQLDDHVQQFISQRATYRQQVEGLVANSATAVVVVDYSTFGLMARDTVKVLGATVIRAVNGAVERHYYDFVGLPVRGRPCDGLSYSLEVLRCKNCLAGVTVIHCWADAGTNDFRNNATLLSLRHMVQGTFANVSVTLNYFGPRHGWSDCDRHFGAAKRHVEKWMRDVATTDVSVQLDVACLLDRLGELSNTTPYDCRPVHVPGIRVDKKCVGISQYLHFCVAGGSIFASRLTELNPELTQLSVSGEMVAPAIATVAAAKRKAKRHAQKGGTSGGKPQKEKTTQKKRKKRK